MKNGMKKITEPEPGLRTFVMYCPDESSQIRDITVRGSVSPYSDFVRKDRSFVITLSPVLYSMDSCPIEQALLEFAVAGITVDFIETTAEDNRFGTRTTAIVDLHKDGPERASLVLAFPRHYVAVARGRLPYVVIDRFAQAPAVDFLSGRFDLDAALCRFKDRAAATEYCRHLNSCTA